MDGSKKAVFAVVTIAAFLAGGVGGFFLGTFTSKTGSAFVEGMFSAEKPADTKNTKRFQSDYVQMEYPDNWRIDIDDEDYDPDTMFSIDSPGSSFCMFIIPGVTSNPVENISAQREEFLKLVQNSEETRFTKWGRYLGEGFQLRGRIFGQRAGVRVFSHSNDENSFIVVQEFFDEDMSMVQPGFDLIERTFTFKKSDTP